jgi:hypothetical protein
MIPTAQKADGRERKIAQNLSNVNSRALSPARCSLLQWAGTSDDPHSTIVGERPGAAKMKKPEYSGFFASSCFLQNELAGRTVRIANHSIPVPTKDQ